MSLHRLPAMFASLCLLLASAQFVSAETPIRLHPANPHYFEWQGRATVLVASGEHYGSVINPDFDFRKYLATIQSAGLNHTRLFLGDYVEGPDSFGIVTNPLAPREGRLLAPWARSATPGFARGGNKFDLDHWDSGLLPAAARVLRRGEPSRDRRRGGALLRRARLRLLAAQSEEQCERDDAHRRRALSQP